jgi:hypothetical protein
MRSWSAIETYTADSASIVTKLTENHAEDHKTSHRATDNSSGLHDFGKNGVEAKKDN